MGKKVDISGRKFERLLVIKDVFSKKNCWYWLCKCDCGKEITVLGSSLLAGNTTSCGCYQSEITSKTFKKHGQAQTGRPSIEYRIWTGMKTRCNNPNHRHYKKYGGRGIQVCERWLNSFENFLSDMGVRLSPQHSLDRYPDTNGNYEPGNCRWATREEQARNKRTNKKIIYKGQEITIGEFIKALGLEGQNTTIYYQLTKRTPDEVAELFQ